MSIDPVSAKQIADLVGVLERGASLEQPSRCPCGCLGTHPRCCRCSDLAARAEKRGDPAPEPELVETWVGENGHRYYAGLCRECADVEWSIRWDRAYEQGSQDKKSALLKVVAAREAAGRNYLGVKRPGGPTTRAHAAECKCQDCRAKEHEESLFP